MMGNSLFVLIYLLARVQITRSNDEYFGTERSNEREQLTLTVNLSVSRVFTV